jgi:hypothetical protein
MAAAAPSFIDLTLDTPEPHQSASAIRDNSMQKQPMSTLQSLNNHQKASDPIIYKHRCDCGKSFKTLHQLKRHQITHLSKSQLSFQCRYCEQRFGRKDKLKVHESAHLNPAFKPVAPEKKPLFSDTSNEYEGRAKTTVTEPVVEASAKSILPEPVVNVPDTQTESDRAQVSTSLDTSTPRAGYQSAAPHYYQHPDYKHHNRSGHNGLPCEICDGVWNWTKSIGQFKKPVPNLVELLENLKMKQ